MRHLATHIVHPHWATMIGWVIRESNELLCIEIRSRLFLLCQHRSLCISRKGQVFRAEIQILILADEYC